MAGLQPEDFARLREKAEQLNRATSKGMPKLSPHGVESLVHELRVHQIELELQCQELHRAQVELEESRNRYRELYESLPLGYLTIDASGKIYDLNPAGATLLGVSREASLNFFSFFSDDDVDMADLFCRKVLAEEEQSHMEMPMKRNDGTIFTAALNAAPVRVGEARWQRLSVAFKDVTRQKEVEASLRQYQVDLEANRVELQDLMGKLFTAQEEERRRIACDLHDDYCQRITALILDASSIEKLVKQALPALEPRITSFKEKLGHILSDFRHLTHELHPRHLDTVSVASSMRTYIKEFSEYTDLRVDFEERDVPSHWPMPITICLYRLLQESLGNIRKHANAKHVTVRLSTGDREIELSVSDDGSGFSLTSMHERVRPFRGSVTVSSQPSRGTTVTVRIPLPSES
jgi:PAS domain S-box-containing protein